MGMGFFNAKYGTFDPAVYEMYIGVALMMLVGFGYLMTFLKQYGLGAVGFTFILTALAVQINVLLTVYLSPSGGDVVVDPYYLMDGNFAAATILISYGCMIGKASPSQLVIMTVIESIVFQINRNYICLEEFKVEDAGGTILIHLFGAYYGLAATKMLGKPKDPSGAESSSVTSDVLSLIGTVFLWLYWPSFNSGGFTGSATDAGRATANTIIGLIASCTFCFITSGLIGGRFNPADIQNATLAGGVAVGAVARMDIGLGWASVIGAAGGAISTLGYQYIQPFLQAKIGLHDTCGVHNLHGMPAVFGGIVSIVMAEAKHDPSILVNPKGEAGGYQAAAMGVSFVIAIVGGAVTGILMKILAEFMKSMVGFTPPKSVGDDGHHFADKSYWMVSETTTEESSSAASSKV